MICTLSVYANHIPTVWCILGCALLLSFTDCYDALLSYCLSSYYYTRSTVCVVELIVYQGLLRELYCILMAVLFVTFHIRHSQEKCIVMTAVCVFVCVCFSLHSYVNS